VRAGGAGMLELAFQAGFGHRGGKRTSRMQRFLSVFSITTARLADPDQHIGDQFHLHPTAVSTNFFRKIQQTPFHTPC